MLLTALLFAGCGVGLLYPATTAALTEASDAMTHSAEISVDVMNYVCGDPLVTALVRDDVDFETYTASRDAASLCTDSSSLVAFATDLSCKLNATVDSVMAYIDGLQDIVDGLQNATNASGHVVSAMRDLKTTVLDVNVSCTDDVDVNISTLNARYVTNKVTSTCCGDVPNLNDPLEPAESYVTEEDVQTIDDAVVDAETAQEDLQNATDEASVSIEDDLRNETMSSLTEAKETTWDTLSNASDTMLDVVEQVDEVRDKILEYQSEYYDEYEQHAIIAFCLLYGLSFIFLLLAMCGYSIRKTWIVQCGGCCIFLTVFYLCVVLGMSVAAWTFLGDTCDAFFTGNAKSNDLGLFQVNLNDETIDVGNETTLILGDTIVEVLRCNGGCVDVAGSSSCDSLPLLNETNTGCDATNNLIDMLALNQELNFTDKVQESIDEMINASKELNYTVELQSAVDELNSSVVNSSLTRNYEVNTTALYQDSNELNAYVPACPSATCTTEPSSEECALWLVAWSFGDGTVGGTSGITGSTCSCTDLNDVSLYDDATTSFWQANCALRDDVDALNATLEACESAANGISDDQDTITSAIDALSEALLFADDVILQKQDDIYAEADKLVLLVDYIIAEAPGHTTCSIVSNAWNVIVESDVCTNLHQNLQNLIAGMTLCVFGMIFGFFAMMDCANPHRMEPAEEKRRRGSMPTAHSWEHPLQDDRGPIDENGRVRVPQTPRRYWNAADEEGAMDDELHDAHAKGVNGPMYPDNDNLVVASPMASSRPLSSRDGPVNATSVVAVSTEESNLYGL